MNVEGSYEMWYSGQSYADNVRIGLATSPDGFSWTKHSGNPVLDVGPPGAWDSAYIYAMSVVKKADRLLMWYWGASDHAGGTERIGLATSHACSPRTLKESALTKLESALSFDPGDDDLVQAIDYLHMSLGDERGKELGSEVMWTDDWHVGEEKGVDTFQYEEEVIDKLDAYVLNDDNIDTGVASIIDSVRDKLYEADKSIAEKAIEEAEAAGGVPSDIDKAKELYKEAVDTYATGTYAHTSPKLSDVIDLFEEAWEKAVNSH